MAAPRARGTHVSQRRRDGASADGHAHAHGRTSGSAPLTRRGTYSARSREHLRSTDITSPPPLVITRSRSSSTSHTQSQPSLPPLSPTSHAKLDSMATPVSFEAILFPTNGVPRFVQLTTSTRLHIDPATGQTRSTLVPMPELYLPASPNGWKQQRFDALFGMTVKLPHTYVQYFVRLLLS